MDFVSPINEFCAEDYDLLNHRSDLLNNANEFTTADSEASFFAAEHYNDYNIEFDSKKDLLEEFLTTNMEIESKQYGSFSPISDLSKYSAKSSQQNNQSDFDDTGQKRRIILAAGNEANLRYHQKDF